ncbi:MAG: hypothetical protein K2K70_06525, partial [Lachnospiraceae bacterium]|nr:hypothetical protein [Lachnospiraceae bacterium]
MPKRLLIMGMVVVLVLSGCSNSNDVKGDIESSPNTQKTKEMEERINLSPTEKVEKVKEYISDRIDNGDDVTTNTLQGDTINVGYSCYAKKDSEELLVNGKRVSPYFYWEDNNDVFDVRLYLSLDGTGEAAIDDTIDKIEIYNTTQSVHYNSTSMNYSDMSLYGGEGYYYGIDLASASDKEDKSEKIDSLYVIFNSQENIYINLTYAKDGVETLTITDYLKKIILAELRYYKEALTYLPNEIKKEKTTEETLPTPVVSTAIDSAKRIKIKQSIKTKFVEMKLTDSKVSKKLTPSGNYYSYKKAGAGS